MYCKSALDRILQEEKAGNHFTNLEDCLFVVALIAFLGSQNNIW